MKITIKKGNQILLDFSYTLISATHVQKFEKYTIGRSFSKFSFLYKYLHHFFREGPSFCPPTFRSTVGSEKRQGHSLAASRLWTSLQAVRPLPA